MKSPETVKLGRLGGLKGGKARAAKLSPERRREIARKAATKRCGNHENITDPFELDKEAEDLENEAKKLREAATVLRELSSRFSNLNPNRK